MRFLLSAARKDLLRIKNDWPALLLWIGIPLMVGGLIVSVGPCTRYIGGTKFGRLPSGNHQAETSKRILYCPT